MSDYIKVRLCDICGKRPASYHQKLMLNGARYEVHLCEQCLNEQRYGVLPQNFQSPAQQTVCKTCGTTLEEISNSPYLGCSDCYKVFLVDTLEKIYAMHHTKKHIGKRLPKAPASKKIELSDRESMEEQLFLAREEGRYSDEEELYNDYLSEDEENGSNR